MNCAAVHTMMWHMPAGMAGCPAAMQRINIITKLVCMHAGHVLNNSSKALQQRGM
jgi:hypothetical protein